MPISTRDPRQIKEMGWPLPSGASIIPAMDAFSARAVRAAYDRVAGAYAEAFGDDLGHLPLDREILDRAFAAAADGGWVLEAGCGPAPAAGHLAESHPGLAARVVGVDLSEAMLVTAGDRNPGLPRAQGDLVALPLRAGSCAVAVAFYALQHLPRPALDPALDELRRVLRPGGLMALAMHLGEGDVFVDEFLGRPVETFAGALYGRDELLGAVAAAGFEVEVERRRQALENEFDSERIYILARSRP